MNILHVVSKLDTSECAEDVIVSTRFLTLNGHKIIVASRPSVFVKKIDEVGARHYEIKIGSSPFLIIITAFRLARIISRENIDIVHARDPLASFVSFLGLRFCLSRVGGIDLRVRTFITTVYGYHKAALFGRSRFWAKRIIVRSDYEAENLVKRGLVMPDRFAVIPPFISAERLDTYGLPSTGQKREGEHAFMIKAVVPLSSPEAVQNLVKAVSIVSRNIHKLRVLIEDNAPRHERDHMEKLHLLIKRHALNAVVSLPGKDRGEHVPDPDVLVQVNSDTMLTIRDLLVSQARGIPIVTTRTPWISDYVEENGTAIVCKENRPQDLAAGILDVYRDAALRASFGKKGREFIRDRFNPKKIMERALALYQDALSRIHILVIKVGALGDVVLAVPSLGAIRKKFPRARITLLIGIENRDIFAHSPLVNDIVVCDFKGRDRALRGILRVAKILRKEAFDIVVDLQNNKRSHLLAFLSSAPKRYGYGNGKLGFLLNRKVRETKLPIEPVEHQLRVLRLLGIHAIDKRMELWTSPEDEEWVVGFLKSHWVKKKTKLVALNIESSPRWATKLWPVTCYVDVCNRLAKEFGIRVVLIGAKKHGKRIDEFLQSARCKPINALGRTNILRLASLIRRCSVLVSSDSAPIHVAAGVGTPFVALFGPTDPARHVPPAPHSVILRKNLECSPCYRTSCKRGNECMESIKPEEVYTAILELSKIKTDVR